MAGFYVPFLRLLLRYVLSYIQRNGDDDNDALYDVVVVGVDAQELEHDLQEFENQNAHEYAADRTYAARRGNAADGSAGDGLKLIADAPPDFAARR